MKAAIVCLALVATPVNRLAHADCLIPPPPCEALARAAIVALVDVSGAAEPFEKVGADTFRPIPQAVKLRLVERFKGLSPRQREITGSIHHNSESVFLKTGKRYLFYTTPNRDGTWITSCSRTKLADAASAELGQLRKCAQAPPAIQEFLATNPAYRLLAVADVRDVVDSVAEEYFTPFASGDLTGDGAPEVTAVVVQSGTPIRFAVVVISRSRTAHCVRRPQPDRIVSRGDSAYSAALYQALP